MRTIEYVGLAIILAAAAVYFVLPHQGTTLGQTVAVTSSADAACHYNGVLPDANCTPGAANPDITQSNIYQTICNSSWSTKSIRPPTSYTDNLKVEQLQDYGSSDQNTKDFEEDHLIPLEVGGNPTDPKNLWPEPRIGHPNSSDKDHFENYLHDQVCSGSLTLPQAQQEIATDWVKYWQQAGSP